jgi:Winged helix DNA-binding domain
MRPSQDIAPIKSRRLIAESGGAPTRRARGGIGSLVSSFVETKHIRPYQSQSALIYEYPDDQAWRGEGALSQMTTLEILQKRQQNQQLTGLRFKQSAEIVHWLGAVQAQDYAGAKWALGVRLPGSTDDQVERAFTDGSILRTHVLRPTWHFVAPADIRWMLELTAQRVHALNAPYYRKCELDTRTFQRSRKVLTKALQGGHQLTRAELRTSFAKAGIPTDGELRMAYLMANAELDGIVCSGARRGQQFTYALLEERAPRARHWNAMRHCTS